jgi:AraC family transcriptional regulator
MSGLTYYEWSRLDAVYSQVPIELRAVGRAQVKIARAVQPAGLYVRTSSDEFNLQLLDTNDIVAKADHGDWFDCITQSGLLSIAPAGTDLSYEVHGDLAVANVMLPRPLLRELIEGHTGRPWSGEFKGLHIGLFKDSLISALAARLWDEATHDFPGGSLLADQILQTLALALFVASGERLAPLPEARGGLAAWQVQRVTRYIDERLAEDVSLADLSDLTGLSTFHLCRAFKQSTGLPPHRWRLKRRIERAREMLGRTDLPVTEIAAAVGYDDPSQLAAAFRKALGVSPSQFRLQSRG